MWIQYKMQYKHRADSLQDGCLFFVVYLHEKSTIKNHPKIHLGEEVKFVRENYTFTPWIDFIQIISFVYKLYESPSGKIRQCDVNTWLNLSPDWAGRRHFLYSWQALALWSSPSGSLRRTRRVQTPKRSKQSQKSCCRCFCPEFDTVAEGLVNKRHFDTTSRHALSGSSTKIPQFHQTFSYNFKVYSCRALWSCAPRGQFWGRSWLKAPNWRSQSRDSPQLP